ncbi:MAG: DegT/DnrJ/EryC1/StrS family aminotransferase [Alphaproteobacteria bacterium]|nr:DegT/DnrJ/EryC1/StrS family aminotransferase [Alphaproteobacteria bacterium]MBF0130731.1 DegT/DnrJ/EryC1/StrS family aminotransferase [Alphaproteobacteria bacterium]
MIPFLDLKAQYAAIKAELEPAVLEALASTQYALGPAVAAFEERFAAYCGVKHAVALNSGTSALHLALLAAGIGPGDEVITVPMTFVATTAAITYAGARPVFVDIDPATWTMDPARIEDAVTERTKAILPVHLHGLTADMDAINAVARRHGLAVIEDAAQAHGAEDKGRRAGSLGDMGCFSFYPGKNLGACGEGGAVVTDDPGKAATMRILRDWGQTEKYNHALKGFNYRMDGLQGAALGVKMRHIEAWTEGRRANADRYDRLLRGLGIGLPAPPAHCRHVYHVYAVRVRGRDAVQKALSAAGVATGIHYPVPVHLQPAHTDLGYKAGDFPVSEEAAREFLSLPMFPELTEGQIEAVAAALAKALEHRP